MKKIAIFFVFCALFLQAASFGPLDAAIQHPTRLRVYAIYPESCEIADDGKIHGSIGLFQTNDYEKEDHYLLDFGMATLQMSGSYAYSDRAQIRLTLPVHHLYGGFMDNALDWFHSFTGSLNGARHNEEGKNKIAIQAIDPDGHVLIDKHAPYTVLGNLQIEHKYLLPFRTFGMHHAVTFGVKVPLSDKKDAFSTEKPDYMAGWLMQKNWRDDALFVNFNVVKLGKFSIGSLAHSLSFGYFAYVGWEHLLGGGRSWLLEYKFASSPYHSAYHTIDSQSNVIDLVWRHRLGKNKLDLFISENLAPFYNSPDFTIGASLRF